MPEAWLKRLHGYFERVDYGDPTLWTWSIAAADFVYLNGKRKDSEGQEGMLGVVARWSDAALGGEALAPPSARSSRQFP